MSTDRPATPATETSAWHAVAIAHARRLELRAWVELLAGLGGILWTGVHGPPTGPRYDVIDAIADAIDLAWSALWTCLALDGVLLVLGVRRLRRRALPAILSRNGAVCPGCGGPTSHEPDGDAFCCTCNRSYAPQALRAAWEAWARRTRPAPPRPYRPAPRAMALRGPLWWAAGLAWAVASLVFTCLVCYSRRSMLVGAARLVSLWLAAVILGVPVWWAWRQTFRRIGSEARCARCGYVRAPLRPVSARCPECGHDWLRPGGVVRGRPALPRWQAILITLGALVLLNLLAIAADPLANLASRLIPTRVLIHAVRSDQSLGIDVEAWRFVQRRSLSPEQRRMLARVLVRPNGMIDPAPLSVHKWIQTEFAAGRLPADVVARLLRSGCEASLLIAGEGRVGQPLGLCVHGGCTSSQVALFVPPVRAFLVFRRLWVDDRLVVDGSNRPGSVARVSPRTQPALACIDWTPRTGGLHRIRAEIWFVALRPPEGFTPQALLAGGDEPPRPAGVLYQKRFFVERSVHVLP